MTKTSLGWLLLPIALLAKEQTTHGPRVIAVTHVTVIDGTGTALKLDMTVLIVGERIAHLGSSKQVNIPNKAHVVDGRGKFLIPGLWDMHVHISDKSYLSLLVANGVTGVRDMGGSPDEFQQLQQWRREVTDGIRIGPRILMAGIHVDGPRQLGRPSSLNVGTSDEARHAVNMLKRGGADFIKVYSMLPRDAYLALAEEAKQQGLPFVGHVPFQVSVIEASDVGQKTIEHLFGMFAACSINELALRDQAVALINREGFGAFVQAELQDQLRSLNGYDRKKATALFARLAKNNTWQVPTLVGWRNLSSPKEFRFPRGGKYLSSEKQETWKRQRTNLHSTLTREYRKNSEKLFHKQLELVGAMHRAGVGILAGTDTATLYVVPGFSLHEELTLLVKAGLSPMEALQAATRNPAKYLDKLDVLGTIEIGKIADMVLLEANPLEKIEYTQRIAGVFMDGHFFSKADLRIMLDEVESSVRHQK